MNTTVANITLADLLKDGNKIICQRGVCLLIKLKPEEKWESSPGTLLWNTKTEEVIGSEDGYTLELVHGNVYYKVWAAGKLGVLNTKTGQLWMSSNYNEVEHIHDHFFAVKKADDCYLLDVNAGKELKYLDAGKIDRSQRGHCRPELKETIEHAIGPYFLAGGLLNVKTGEHRTDGEYYHVHGHHFRLRKDGLTFLVNVKTGKSQKLDMYLVDFRHMKKSFFWCEGLKTKGEYRRVKPFVLNFQNGKITKLA